MKTLSTLTAGGMLSVLLSLNVSAASYQDIDVINQLMNQGDGAGVNSYTGTFDIADGDGDTGDIFGYAPNHPTSPETILSGSILFIFDNPTFGRKTVSIGVSDEDFITPNTTLSFGTVIFGDLISGQAYLDLDSTGVASYRIDRIAGEFTLLGAELYVESGPRAQIPNVPDAGTTASLLGWSLLGLGFVALKLKRHLA